MVRSDFNLVIIYQGKWIISARNTGNKTLKFRYKKYFSLKRRNLEKKMLHLFDIEKHVYGLELHVVEIEFELNMSLRCLK